LTYTLLCLNIVITFATYHIIGYKIKYNLILFEKSMHYLNFALAHSEFGISHFTTDLILVLSFAIVTALPMSLLRPHIREDNVKSSLFSSK